MNNEFNLTHVLISAALLAAFSSCADQDLVDDNLPDAAQEEAVYAGRSYLSVNMLITEGGTSTRAASTRATANANESNVLSEELFIFEAPQLADGSFSTNEDDYVCVYGTQLLSTPYTSSTATGVEQETDKTSLQLEGFNPKSVTDGRYYALLLLNPQSTTQLIGYSLPFYRPNVYEGDINTATVDLETYRFSFWKQLVWNENGMFTYQGTDGKLHYKQPGQMTTGIYMSNALRYVDANGDPATDANGQLKTLVQIPQFFYTKEAAANAAANQTATIYVERSLAKLTVEQAHNLWADLADDVRDLRAEREAGTLTDWQGQADQMAMDYFAYANKNYYQQFPGTPPPFYSTLPYRLKKGYDWASNAQQLTVDDGDQSYAKGYIKLLGYVPYNVNDASTVSHVLDTKGWSGVDVVHSGVMSHIITNHSYFMGDQGQVKWAYSPATYAGNFLFDEATWDDYLVGDTKTYKKKYLKTNDVFPFSSPVDHGGYAVNSQNALVAPLNTELFDYNRPSYYSENCQDYSYTLRHITSGLVIAAQWNPDPSLSTNGTDKDFDEIPSVLVANGVTYSEQQYRHKILQALKEMVADGTFLDHIPDDVTGKARIDYAYVPQVLLVDNDEDVDICDFPVEYTHSNDGRTADTHIDWRLRNPKYLDADGTVHVADSATLFRPWINFFPLNQVMNDRCYTQYTNYNSRVLDESCYCMNFYPYLQPKVIQELNRRLNLTYDEYYNYVDKTITGSTNQYDPMGVQRGIVRYHDGQCYYTVFPRHFTDEESNGNTAYTKGQEKTVNYIGRYGMVRNHWYAVTVNSVALPGSPWFPNPRPEGELPDYDVDDDTQYMDIQIRQMAWAKRTNSLSF